MIVYKSEYIFALQRMCQNPPVELVFAQHKIAREHSNLIKGLWREEGGGRREEGVKVTLRGEGRGLEGREKKNEINSSVSHSGPSWLCVAFRAP